MQQSTDLLEQWRAHALELEQITNQIVVGQQRVIRLVTIAIFSRGHVLLEGPVGVGKTTLLRTISHCLGGKYQRVEGTIDMMPNDLIYYTWLDEEGHPRVDPGPLLHHGEQLSTFFFNEINRARPHVHSLLLRVMAERSLNAFNREYQFNQLQVFADRNKVEREETFELPAAARDRFLMEIHMDHPTDDTLLDDLMFNPRYHDTDTLIAEAKTNTLPYQQLPQLAAEIQRNVSASPTLRRYALDLWKATHQPEKYGIRLEDMGDASFIANGASPRGMSYLVRAARVQAWLEGREAIIPEDLQYVFEATMAHRIFLDLAFDYRRDEIMPVLMNRIISSIAAP